MSGPPTTPSEAPREGPTFSSSEQQREAYLEGHRRNPLTTTKLGGRILSASQVPWFLVLPPRGFGVLTTIGRKTGKKRRKCVRAIKDGDKAYLVSLPGSYSAWMRNLRAHPEVTLRIREGRFSGIAREITDPVERDKAHSVYCGACHPFEKMAYRMHRSGRPTRDKIKDLHEHWFSVGTPLVIELQPKTR